MIGYVRAQGAGVISTLGRGGEPQAAYLPIAATDSGELVFDAKPDSRKIANIQRDARIAVVIGGTDGTTLQAEGRADLLDGTDLARCSAEYLDAFPEFSDSVLSEKVVVVRVRLDWARFGDFRTSASRVAEVQLVSPETRRLL